eukprot:121855_1
MASTTLQAAPIKPNLPWCETVDPDPVLVFQYWAVLTVWIINMLLSGWSAYHLFARNENSTKPVFKILFAIIAALFITAAAGFAFATQAGWDCWYDFTGWEATIMIGLVSYQYGLAVLCFFFILRLKTISAAGAVEKFQLHKFTMWILTIGIVVQIICPIMSCYYFMKAWDPIVRQNALRWVHGHTYTNVIVNSFILILFIKRILLLTESQTIVSPNNESSVASDTTGSVNIDVEKVMQKKTIEHQMLSLAIRYMVCAVFAMLSSVIVVIWGIIRSEATEFHNDPKYVLRMRGIHSFLTPFDGTINLICLILQFPFGKGMYFKCCQRVDKCFQKCFVKCLHLDIKGKSEMQLTAATSNSSKSPDSGASTGPTMELSI